MRKQFGLASVALLAYGWSLSGSFHFDDYSLAQSPLITTASGLWRMWAPLETRPLTNFTFWANNRVGGTEPIGYHAVNLALHVTAVLLLHAALQAVMPGACALWAAVIFAVHPVQSEAVCYIFARSTLLSTVCCLASFWFWVRNRLPWSLILFAFALLAKEDCVTFPLVLLVSSSLTRRRVQAIAVMIALAALAGARVLWATAHIAGSGAGFSSGISPLAYFLTQGLALLRYIRLLVIPWGFTIEPTIDMSSPLLYAAAWAAVLTIAGAAFWAFRKRYPWAVWMLCGFILLIPSSTIFPAADLAADRRMYLPMIGFAAAIGVVMPSVRIYLLITIAGCLTILSIARTEVWRTEEGLWREASSRSPTHIRPLLQLAHFVPQKEAPDLLTLAKTRQPNNPAVASELGRTWLAVGNYALALQEFGRALALDPTNANAFNNRGAALLALKQQQAAKLDFERALRLDPCEEAARRNLVALGGTSLPPCKH